MILEGRKELHYDLLLFLNGDGGNFGREETTARPSSTGSDKDCSGPAMSYTWPNIIVRLVREIVVGFYRDASFFGCF